MHNISGTCRQRNWLFVTKILTKMIQDQLLYRTSMHVKHNLKTLGFTILFLSFWIIRFSAILTRTASQITNNYLPSLISFDTQCIWTRAIFLYVHPQVVYYNSVKFLQYQFIHLEKVMQTRNTDGQSDRLCDYNRLILCFREFKKVTKHQCLLCAPIHRVPEYKDEFDVWNDVMDVVCYNVLWFRLARILWKLLPLIVIPE